MSKPSDRLMPAALMEYWTHSPDMAFVKDLNGIYISASMPFILAAGWTCPDDVIGKTDHQVFADQELAKRYVDDDERLLAGGVSLENYIEPIPSKSGRPRYSVTSKYILRDEDHNVLGILGVSRDITLEYEAQRAYESELASLFDLPPDAPAAVLFDITAWRVVDARFREGGDRVVSRYTRIDEYFENVLPRIIDCEEATEFFSTATRESLQEIYASGKRNRSLEYLRRMPDGSARWVRDELHLLLDPVNGNLSLIIVLHDIDADKRKYSDLVQAAERDSMTNLLNHDATIRCIEQYLANASGMQALFMIDLDSFKQINDTFGHQYGDSILMSAAAAISGVFRGTDIIGRIGGDEFMVLMKDASSETTVRHRGEALINALQFSASSDGIQLELSASIGIALFSAGARSFSELYSEADAALYAAKRSGKNRYCLFGSDGAPSSVLEPTVLPDNVSTVQLRTLLDYMDGGVVMAEITERIRITYVSPSLFRSFGRNPSENGLIDEHVLLSSIVAEDRAAFMASLHEAALSNDLADFSFRVMYSNGIEWRRMLVKRIPQTGDNVCRIVAVITDITEIRRINEHLRETEMRYRTAVEQTNAMLWEVDIADRTLALLGSAWDIYGFDRLSYPCAPESFIRTGVIDKNSELEFRRMFDDMYHGRNGNDYYIKAHDRTGHDVWAKAQFKLLLREDGSPHLALGITMSAPNVTADMRLFDQEQRFVDVVKDCLFGYVCANFTKNELLAAEYCDDKLLYADYVGGSFDAYFQAVATTCIHGDDRSLFAQTAAREILLEKFLTGENWLFSDYRRMDAENGAHWVKLFIKLMRHPISGDVYAFAYLRRNDFCRRLELMLKEPVRRSASLLLYAPETLAKLAQSALSDAPSEHTAALSVVELSGLDRIRSDAGESGAVSQLYTFGRLCRIAVHGDVLIGQMDENHIAMLQPNAGDTEQQREYAKQTLAQLEKLLRRSYPDTKLRLFCGYTTERADYADYDRMLHEAISACKAAAALSTGSVVAYR